MDDVGIFYVHSVYFVAIWYVLRPFGMFCVHLAYIMYGYLVYFIRFGTFFPFLVCCTKNNLATLDGSRAGCRANKT
jgi:hypothetical protein